MLHVRDASQRNPMFARGFSPHDRSSECKAAHLAGLALRIRDGLAAVAEWEAKHGALTEGELEAARARLTSLGPRRRKAR